MQESPLVWKARDDVYLHCDIILRRETFESHVLNEKNRLELIGEEDTIRGVVENPNYIFQDEDYESRIHYGGARILKCFSYPHWISVVVETAENPPVVCTILHSRKMPKLEVLYDGNTRANAPEL